MTTAQNKQLRPQTEQPGDNVVAQTFRKLTETVETELFIITVPLSGLEENGKVQEAVA